MLRSIDEALREVRIEQIDTDPGVVATPDTPLGRVYRLLDENRTGAVLICDGEEPVGIFTDRDVLYRTSLEQVDRETPIGELMSRDLETLRPDQSLAEAIACMNQGGHRHVPLVDDAGRSRGMISGRDVLRWVAGRMPEAVLNLPPRLHQTLTRAEGG